MKTKYLILFLFASILLIISACNEKQQGLRKFQGNWTIDKIEYYDISGGNYVLRNTVSSAGYFLLYDQMQVYDDVYTEQLNDCIYHIDSSATSAMISPLLNTGYCLWYVPAKNQITLTNTDMSVSADLTVQKKGANKMEWTYKGVSSKEVYYLKRINV